ncbi:acid protease [Cristinia sonorae]|uniref:Acid protease n=1 Tax=Cristinia sonorae TaxID=1940300 RepID=A0A8K0XL35_9AGAR|nr:acid protease [Cristinia sonorae]
MLTIAFVVSALQLLVAASPSPLPNGVQQIDLARRQVHNATAPADVDGITAQIEGTLTKHAVGFDAFKENVGQVHPLVADLTGVTKRAPSSGQTPLVSDSGMWLGSMTAGTPVQGPFRVGFDTGSASLLLINAACTSTDCQSHPRYNPAVSTTSTDRKQQFNLKITDTETVSGQQYADTVSVVGVSATGQVLGAASTYPTSFNTLDNPPDGRMGLGYQAISAYKSPSVPQTLVAQNALVAPVFTFYMGPNTPLGPVTPRITFGAIDGTSYQGAITYTPVTTKGFWQINLDSVQANGQKSVGRTPAIIDTGSSLIVGDRANVERFYATVPGAQAFKNGLYTVPCDNIPAVTISIGGTAFPIDPQYFNQGPVSVGSTQCVGGIVAAPTTKPPMRYWSIGDVFLMNVYSIFDLGANRVGFATST